MEFRNLEKNILYRICTELVRRGRCDSLDVDFVQRIFPDIPRENINESVSWLVDGGWLRKKANHSQVHLTESGRTAIRSMVPSILRQDCIKSVGPHQKR